MTIEIRQFTGAETTARLPDLAKLRIRVFREYPYCYDGDQQSERGYLRVFGDAPESDLVAALDGGEMVGAATASPLWAQDQDVREPFENRGIETADLFYFGESVLLPDYRDKGIGRKFFELREDHARKNGADRASFCALVPSRRRRKPPAGYRPNGEFWKSIGYRPLRGLVTSFDWTEIGDSEPSPHTMQFWIKDL